MTETLITHLPSPGNVRPGWLGTPLADVEARIAEGGELEIRSPMNMLGYYRDFAGTAQAFTLDGFVRTGDLGRIDTDGQLCLLGRIKEQFKTSKGKYVAPSPIESQLCAHPSVESCCLMGAGQPTPFAVIVLSPDARQKCAVPRYREELEASLTSRMNEVNSRLDPHERVAFIAVVEGPWSVGNGLMTPTLKVKRAALENAYTPLVDAWYRQGRPVVWECELREGVTGA
jgi:long-chain acyl-CoA synthetase